MLLIAFLLVLLLLCITPRLIYEWSHVGDWIEPGYERDPLWNVNRKGGGSPPKQQKQKEQKLPKIPQPAPLPPPPPPPPLPNQEIQPVDQEKRDQKKKEARRQGIAKTLLAGETGGYEAAATTPATEGKKTLLG